MEIALFIKKVISSGIITQVSELIKAFAALTWPLFAFSFVFLFKSEISKTFGRIKKGKLFGNELELSPEVVKLQETTNKASEEAVNSKPELPENNDKNELTENDIVEILKIAESEPELAVIKLSTLIEKEIRIELALRGQVDNRFIRIHPMRYLNDFLSSSSMSNSAKESLITFWKLRNEVVHGNLAKTNRDILSILDTGISLLRIIRSIPHEFNVVVNPGAALYSDEECKNMIEGVKGLILEARTNKGTFVNKRIFPTTNSEYYKKGERVTWEWKSDRKWDQAFFIDPETNQKKQAWLSSMEFAGRHLKDV